MSDLILPLKQTCSQLLLYVVPTLGAAFLMGAVSKLTYGLLTRLIGPRIYHWLFGWLGTTVHELGHAMMCIAFLHRIERIKLFTLNPDADYAGYVAHSYNPLSPYQLIGNFLVIWWKLTSDFYAVDYILFGPAERREIRRRDLSVSLFRVPPGF